MSIKLSLVMTRGDWIKLGILLVVGAVSISILLKEYQKTNTIYNDAYSQAVTSAQD